MTATTQRLYACYRRPDPATAQLHRDPPQAGVPLSPIAEIEYAVDPALFFHAEKFRGTNEEARLAIMACPSLAAGQEILDTNPLNDAQRRRWQAVRDRALRCACWFGAAQWTSAMLALLPESFDGLDVTEEMRHVQERLKNPTRLIIAGSRSMTDRRVGFALIDWFVSNRQLGETGHGLAGPVDEIVSCNANGGDSIGEEWALNHYVPVSHCPPDLNRISEIMKQRGTHLLALHLGGSPGTASMIDAMLLAKKNFWSFTDDDIDKMGRMLASQSSGD